jgi:hypothetical protein
MSGLLFVVFVVFVVYVRHDCIPSRRNTNVGTSTFENIGFRPVVPAGSCRINECGRCC